MKITGVGGFLGILLGIGVAEWLGSDNDAAYYSVVVFGGLLGTVTGFGLGRLFPGNAHDDDPEE